jgi:DNA adenine methylase
MQKCKGDILISYDNTTEIAKLAEKSGFQTKTVTMKNTHHAKMTELLIGRDLSWLKDTPALNNQQLPLSPCNL